MKKILIRLWLRLCPPASLWLPSPLRVSAGIRLPPALRLSAALRLSPLWHLRAARQLLSFAAHDGLFRWLRAAPRLCSALMRRTTGTTCCAATTDLMYLNRYNRLTPVRFTRAGVSFCISPSRTCADIKRQRRGVRHVEALDRARHVHAGHHAAGLARELAQALAFGAQHQRQRRRSSTVPRSSLPSLSRPTVRKPRSFISLSARARFCTSPSAPVRARRMRTSPARRLLQDCDAPW